MLELYDHSPYVFMAWLSKGDKFTFTFLHIRKHPIPWTYQQWHVLTSNVGNTEQRTEIPYGVFEVFRTMTMKVTDFWDSLRIFW
jgi:hypothetical protein